MAEDLKLTPQSAYLDAVLNTTKPPHLRGLLMVGGTGLEPVTPSLSSWCSPN
jgi:hypothetical protein